MAQYSFFAFLSRMKHIRRWSLMRNMVEENVQEHSFQVAMIAHGLAELHNRVFGGNVNPERIVLLSMYHDAGETITGDLPTPIKYFNPNLSQAYKDLEEIASDKILSMLPDVLKPAYEQVLKYDESSVEGRLIKAADRLCALIKCVEEEKNGNREFVKARQATLEKLKQMDMQEVQYFLEHFMEHFELTLDELN